MEELIKFKVKSDNTDNALATNDAEIQGTIIHILSYTKEPFPSLQSYQEAYLAAQKIAEAKRKPFTCVYLIWNVVQV